MRLLVLCFYYQPDLCAGSFRCTALVEQLRRFPDCRIEVVTTLPNRYASYSCVAPEYEEQGNLRIHRVRLPPHRSGMFDQARAYTRYFRRALALTRRQEYDIVVASTGRLFTSLLGARIASAKKVPLYLDVRDIFVDTITDMLPRAVSFFAEPVLSLVERYAFGRAARINLVSRGFSPYFAQRYPTADLRWFTNGIDEEFIGYRPAATKAEPAPGRPLRVLCAGNIGEGQGLHAILPALGRELAGRVEFEVIGDGGKKTQLREALLAQKVTNVRLSDPVNRRQLIQAYQTADVLFLHLSDYPALTKVLPSKLFEYAAMGKPLWAGVTGYAAQFIREEIDNAAVFYPGSVREAVERLGQLKLVDRAREAFVAKYARTRIMEEMARDIVACCGEGRRHAGGG